MVEPVRMGLVGYGFGGRYFHAPLLASASEVDFLGVVTRSPERRAQVSGSFPELQLFDDLQALRESGVEAVAVSTPADTHIDLTIEALELGMAVVCDKPFSLDESSARRAVETAEATGLPLSVYQNRRWDSDFLTVSRLVREGALGDVIRFESAFERFQPDPGPPRSGGGTLRDFGSHLVDQALHLFGPVESVYAELHDHPDSGIDDDVMVVLQHRDGVRSQLRGSWTQGAPAPRFRVTGTAGSYVVDGPMDVQEPQLLRDETPATLGQSWGQETDDRGSAVRRGDEQIPVPLERGRWDTYYPAFASAVRGLGPVPVDPHDAVRTASVLDAARRSALSGDLERLSAGFRSVAAPLDE